MSDEKLREINHFETSAAFSDLERLVLRFAIAMTSVPADVPQALFDELKSHFDEAQLVNELLDKMRS